MLFEIYTFVAIIDCQNFLFSFAIIFGCVQALEAPETLNFFFLFFFLQETSTNVSTEIFMTASTWTSMNANTCFSL